jgi:PAS domain S-box-containing protein
VSLGSAQRAVLNQSIGALRENILRTIRWSTATNVIAAVVATGILVFFGLITIRHLSHRQRLERKIQASNIELESVVHERTRELEGAAQTLRTELANRERHEQLLRESEERFRLLVAGVKDYAIFRLDPQGYITSWNAGAERIKGYTANEIIGQHFSIFYTDEDRKAEVPRKVLETAVREGKYEAEAVRMRKGGTRFFAHVVIDPLRDESGRLVGFAKITRDVTRQHQQQLELEAARTALAQSQKMEALGQLSGGIAHDFNNLLHVIKNAAAILDRRLPESAPEISSALDMIKRSANRAAELTHRLLAFSRRQPLQPQRVDPQKLVRDMEPLLKSALGASIGLQIDAKPVWPVSADPGQLETAILNLAVNARDAMSSGGTLTVETTNAYLDEEYVATHEEAKPGEYALISVTDTGAGMAPEVIAKAFEPFFTTKEIGQGTGLGLSQVYGFIQQSGGYVDIDSEVGRGTTIRLYLPRLTATMPEVAPPIERATTGPATETILLVEDEQDVRLFTAAVLSEHGYRVLTAADASSALAVLASNHKVDLLFTDVGLPNGVDGRQLVDEAHKRWPQLKVLFTTGYARSGIVHYGQLDPGIQLIVKPFSESSLANRVRKVLDAAPVAPHPHASETPREPLHR